MHGRTIGQTTEKLFVDGFFGLPTFQVTYSRKQKKRPLKFQHGLQPNHVRQNAQEDHGIILSFWSNRYVMDILTIKI